MIIKKTQNWPCSVFRFSRHMEERNGFHEMITVLWLTRRWIHIFCQIVLKRLELSNIGALHKHFPFYFFMDTRSKRNFVYQYPVYIMWSIYAYLHNAVNKKFITRQGSKSTNILTDTRLVSGDLLIKTTVFKSDR